MTYQAQTSTLVEQVQAQVAAAFAAYLAGQLTADALVALVGAFVAAGNSGGAALGDLSLAAAVTLATGSPAAPLGAARPANEPERLERAAQTILDGLEVKQLSAGTVQDVAQFEADLDHAQMRYMRVVEAEIRKSVAEAYAEGVEKNKNVVGWTRGLEPEACQLCRWWARDGKVWPADHEIPRHKGCDCSQIIVTTTREDEAS